MPIFIRSKREPQSLAFTEYQERCQVLNLDDLIDNHQNQQMAFPNLTSGAAGVTGVTDSATDPQRISSRMRV